MKRLAIVASLLLLLSCAVLAQQTASPKEQTAPPQGERRSSSGERGEMRLRGTGGTVTDISGDTITLKSFNGQTVKVKVSDKTEYHKEQQPAKLSDFKPGDLIMVRGEPS